MQPFQGCEGFGLYPGLSRAPVPLERATTQGFAI